MRGTCNMEGRISIIMEHKMLQGTDENGQRRRRFRRRWTACARDVEGSIVVVVGHHPMIYDETLLRTPFFYAAFFLAPVCGERATDEFYATRSFTRLVTYVNETVIYLGVPCVKSERRTTLFARRSKHRLILLRGRLKLWEFYEGSKSFLRRQI